MKSTFNTLAFFSLILMNVLPAQADGEYLGGTRDTTRGRDLAYDQSSSSDHSSRSDSKLVSIENASPERRAAALGHYSRAKTMLLDALDEFARAEQIAQPNQVLISSAWRASVEMQSRDLDRIINPEARVSVSGARFEASNSGIRLPGARKTYTPKPAVEKISKKKLRKPAPSYSRAKMSEDSPAEVSVESKKTPKENTSGSLIVDRPDSRKFVETSDSKDNSPVTSDESRPVPSEVKTQETEVPAVELPLNSTDTSDTVTSDKISQKIEEKMIEKNPSDKIEQVKVQDEEKTTTVNDEAALRDRLNKLAEQLSTQENAK